jgi:hypothetical protein
MLGGTLLRRVKYLLYKQVTDLLFLKVNRVKCQSVTSNCARTTLLYRKVYLDKLDQHSLNDARRRQTLFHNIRAGRGVTS